MAVIFYPPRNTGGGGGGAATWGSITGTLSAQTDLQTALNGKSDVGHTHTNINSLVGFATSENTSAPNNTVNASRLLVVASTTNADFVIEPKGTGAIIGELPDSAIAGGNKRGANAIDLQLSRTLATQVASGASSALVGGTSNIANAISSGVFAGNSNTTTRANAVILGGGSNSITGTADNASILAGLSNSNSGASASIIGGQNNIIDNSVYTAIISGQNNQITGGSGTCVIVGGQSNVLTNALGSVILGGRGFTAQNYNILGFNANIDGTRNISINAAVTNTAVFNNVDLWLSNNDNTPRTLRFYEQYNSAGVFPNGTNYVAFRAPNSIAADVTWTLPNADGTNGQVLQTNGTGTLSWATAGGGISGFTSAAFASTPNSTVNVSQLLVVAATTNGDLALTPKGTGSILAQVPNNLATGGDKRGIYSVDLQMVRSSSAQVVSGAYSFASGRNNTVSGQDSAALGHNNNVRSGTSFCVGTSNTASNLGNHNYLIGESNVSSTNRVFAWGANNNMSTGTYMSVFGIDNSVDHAYTWVFGNRAKTYNRNSIVLSDSPGTTSRGCSQLRVTLLRATANSTSQFPMTDGASGIVIPPNTALSVEFTIVGKRRTDSGCCVFRRIITCLNNSNTSTLIGSVETVGTDFNNALGGVAVAITVNDATDSIDVNVNGRVSETIDFTATAIITQVSSFA